MSEMKSSSKYGPVYLIRIPGDPVSVWREATQDAYEVTPADKRRVLHPLSWAEARGDNLRDSLGQAISDVLSVWYGPGGEEEPFDICDSNNIDALADAVVASIEKNFGHQEGVCQGINCGAKPGEQHSHECQVEAAMIQGWADSTEARAHACEVFKIGPTDEQLELLFNAVHIHGEFGQGFLDTARGILETPARIAEEADPLPDDSGIETEEQGFALEAIWQFVPELKPREDSLVVLTPAQAEKLLRRLEWVPPPEWQAKVGRDAITSAYGTCQISGPREDVEFIVRHLPDADGPTQAAPQAGEAKTKSAPDWFGPSLFVARLIDRVVRDVAELPDRNSPEDRPETMLVTRGELADIIRAALPIGGAFSPASQPMSRDVEQPKPRTDVVPGKVHCSACGFTLFRTNLYVNSGTTGPGDERTEPCPNDGNPLLPVTWEQEAREGWKVCEQMFDRAVSAEKALVASLATLKAENEKEGGPIVDTIWHAEGQTLFEFMEGVVESSPYMKSLRQPVVKGSDHEG